jgi:hypothetical protein
MTKNTNNGARCLGGRKLVRHAAARVHFPSGWDAGWNARACREAAASDTLGSFMSWDWARGTLTGWQDELCLNRRLPFPPPPDASPDVPAIRAGLEPVRAAVEPPALRNHDLRLGRRRAEDERVPSEQLDVIPRGAPAGSPGETMGGCDRGRLSRRGSRRRGRRRFRLRSGRARRLVLERDRRVPACRDRHAWSVAVDHEHRRRDYRQAQDGRDEEPEPASPPDRPGWFRGDRRRVAPPADLRRRRSRRPQRPDRRWVL